jgi:hypothetical protein
VLAATTHSPAARLSARQASLILQRHATRRLSLAPAPQRPA